MTIILKNFRIVISLYEGKLLDERFDGIINARHTLEYSIIRPMLLTSSTTITGIPLA